jgi:hypothetical protein
MVKLKLHPCTASGAEFLCARSRVKPISLRIVQYQISRPNCYYKNYPNTLALVGRSLTIGGYFFLNLALARRRMEAEEVPHGGKIGGLHVLSENPLPYSGFVRNEQSFLEGILLRLFMVPAEIPRQYSSSQGGCW